ncbi:unnamed protein product [Phytophthora lilii]|uniref:Unnamed protein product n=1 Tax=Phytophthora lilii TaxID=2077276 RepID=A0A9W6TYY1_9STRA|nr:unnamed protein product [Phytophthora lilii]
MSISDERFHCAVNSAPIRFAHEVSEHVKKEALRLLKEVMALEDKPPANEPEDAKLAGHKAENNGDEETSNGDEEPNDDNH